MAGGAQSSCTDHAADDLTSLSFLFPSPPPFWAGEGILDMRWGLKYNAPYPQPNARP